MVFTAEYEYALRAIAFGILIGAWIVARAAFGQPVVHPWLGALVAGLFGSVGTTIAVIPGMGPLPGLVSTIGALLAGLLFTAGVRCEAVQAPLRVTGMLVLVIAAVIGGLALQFGIPDPPVRVTVRQACVGVAVLGTILWVPTLWRAHSAGVGALALGVASLGIAFDRATPFLRGLVTHNAATLVFPYIHRTDILTITAGGVAMIVYSAERALRTRTQGQADLRPALDKE